MQLPSYTNMDHAPPPHLILDPIHNPRNPTFKFTFGYQDLLSHSPNRDRKKSSNLQFFFLSQIDQSIIILNSVLFHIKLNLIFSVQDSRQQRT